MRVEEMIQRKAEYGYSLKTISEKSGVPVVTLQKIFAGKTENPRKNTLYAIEQVFSAEKDTAGEEYAPGKQRKMEVMDGVLYEPSSSGTLHQDIVFYIHKSFYEYIREKQKSCRVFEAPIDVFLEGDKNSRVEPDLIVVCDPEKIHGSGIFGTPDFVLEVLSKESRKKDMTIKLQKYMDTGVREYWMIDPDKEKLIIYNFMEEEFFPSVYLLRGKAPVAVFSDGFEISLEEVAEIIHNPGILE